MFNPTFIIKQPSPTQVVLRFNVVFRLVFYGLAAFMLYITLGHGQLDASNAGPFLFIGICALLGSYHEAWVFDQKRDLVSHQHGLLFLHFSTTTPLSSIDRFVLHHFEKGRYQKPKTPSDDDITDKNTHKQYFKLTLQLKEGRQLDLEIVSHREEEKIKKQAELLANFCKRPLITE